MEGVFAIICEHHSELVHPGQIIVRQRGTKFNPAKGVGLGRDHTVFALIDGHVHFRYDRINKKQYVSVLTPAAWKERMRVRKAAKDWKVWAAM